VVDGTNNKNIGHQGYCNVTSNAPYLIISFAAGTRGNVAHLGHASANTAWKYALMWLVILNVRPRIQLIN